MANTGLKPQDSSRPRRAREGGRLSSSQRSRPLILLVEDDPNDREIYGKTLWYNGFDVVEGDDGKAALGLAREHVPDLVVVDLLLPGLNGIEVCRRLKADPVTAEIPVIALTARSEREFGLLAQDAGVMSYLEKPIGPLQVLKAVEAVVGRPPPVDDGREGHRA
jgi:two-component system, OmpR family, phosphate regulon response regulator PhoB